MPAGNPGTTLTDELNRLANGGTYPPISEYVDNAAGALGKLGSEVPRTPARQKEIAELQAKLRAKRQAKKNK